MNVFPIESITFSLVKLSVGEEIIYISDYFIVLNCTQISIFIECKRSIYGSLKESIKNLTLNKTATEVFEFLKCGYYIHNFTIKKLF
jgi:hypothetical protein